MRPLFNHKPLEWLTTIFDVNDKKGRWIFMVKDFHFKIFHRLGNKHANVDALSKNPIFILDEEKGF
jgi:hypothetical protein